MRYLILFIFSLSLFSCTIGTEKEEYLNNETDTLFQIFTDSTIQASETKVNRSLLKFEQKISTPQTKYQEIMLELASLYSLKEKGEIDTAIKGFEKVVAILKLQEEPRLKRKLLDINLTIGTIYLYEKNDMQKALPNFLEAKRLSEKYGNVYQQAEVNKYLGYVYFRQSNAIDARKSFEDALKVYYEIASTERPNHYVIQEQISNIGLSYYALKNYEKAVEYFDSTISYVNHKLKNYEDEDAKFVAKSIAEGNKARALINLGNKEEAKKLLRKNYEQKKNHPRYKENAITEYFALTRLVFEQDLKLGKNYLDTLSILVEEKPRKDVEQKLERLKAKYYESANPEKAIEIYKTQLAYKDSTYKALTQLNLRTKLDEQAALESNLRIALAEKELKTKNSLSNFYLFISIISFIFLILLLFFLVRFRNKNKDLKALNNRILQQKETIDGALVKLQAANDKLNNVNSLKTGILGIVAHDLKNPFDAINSTINLIKEEDDIDPKELDELLGLIKLSAESAHSIISELNIYAQLENKGNQIINFSSCDVNEIIKTSIFMNKLKAKEKNISINFEVKPMPRLNIDNDRMIRVFSNLISNAIKFSDRNKNIRIKVKDKQDHLSFEVTDEGMGIPKDLLGSLFEPFSRARRSGTEGERSTGLGLSIVKKIIDAHNGKIRINSMEEEGTTFCFTIPKNLQLS